MSIRKRTWKVKEEDEAGEIKEVEHFAWVVDYKDQHGKRRLKSFKKKKDADSWATSALFQVKQGTHTADSASITVKEAAENWIKRAELESRERSTIAQYRQHVDYHIIPLIGNVKLSKLTAPGMEDVRDKLLDRLSRPMAKKVLGSIKGILKDAQRRGNVSQNVAQGVSIKMEKRHKRKIRVGTDIPSKEEIRDILDKAEGRWRPLLVTAIFTGLRASELRGLTWDDVDLKAKEIHVRQRADRYNEIGSPKSHAGERKVPMSPMVVNALKEWKLACPKSGLTLVFPNGAGNVESLGNIYRRGFGAVQEKCGMVIDSGRKDNDGIPIMRPKYGVHALRHFAASWMIEQGFPPKRLQDLIGHGSIQMTFDTYGHLFPNAEDDHAKLAAGELFLAS
ncbi:MAG: tyrosine-type recombinase/integrase [Kiloniellales bacterium]